MIKIVSTIWDIGVDVFRLLWDAYKNINASTKKTVITTSYHSDKELKLIEHIDKIQNVPRCVFDASLEEDDTDVAEISSSVQ